MKLSIVMMVKDESKHLEDVLKSINPISEQIDYEIIVLDTGSSDNTVEIAKKYTDKVFFKKWNNNFSSMRNKSISYATGEWVFILDDDDFRYIGSIHEQPNYKDPHIFLDLTLIHYGYLATDSELIEIKFKRNSELLHAQLRKDPQNIYILHHLSNIYGMHKEQDKALYYSEKAYRIAKIKNLDLSQIMYVYLNLATALWNNKKYSSLKKICKEAITVNNNYMDFFYYLGNVYSMMGETDNAINNFECYLNLVRDYENPNHIKNITLTQNTISHKNKVIAILCNLYEREKNMSRISRFYKRRINFI